MPTYCFHLGREPEISTAEIEAVFSAGNTKYAVRERRAERLIVETKQPLDTAALMQRLGGTIKISEQIISAKSSPLTIISHLTQVQPVGKIEFAINDRRLTLQIKKSLKAAGRGARFITINNTATILFNQLVEKQSDLTVLGDQVFATRAIQPIAELSARDYGRPGSDAHSGMLPPKLARMLINLAQVKEDAVILDPFCGSGTILTEAAAMGYANLIGSDISKQAIENTKKNLNWLTKTYNPASPVGGLKPITYNLYTNDVRSLDQVLKPHSIDAIITEPYLGKPLTGRESRAFLESQAQELATLYAETFASFHKILKPNGVVVFILPAFRFKNDWIAVPIIDEIKKLGYKPMSFLKNQSSLRYHRPSQHLARDIWQWQYNFAKWSPTAKAVVPTKHLP